MKKLLLAFLAVANAANYTFIPNVTYLGKRVVNSTTLPKLDMGDAVDIVPKLVSVSSFMRNKADAVVYSVDTNKYGIETARVFLQLFLTPDKKYWDTAKTIPGFAWDGPGDVGVWSGKCYDVGRVQRAIVAFKSPKTATNIAMYMACYPEPKATLWIAKDGYTIKSIAAPEFVNDNRWNAATDSIWTNDKLQSTCKNPRALEGLRKGAPGDCCMYTTDCAGDNVCDINGRCALCSSKFIGRKTGDYVNGQCCNGDDDCSGKCLDGRCRSTRCTSWPTKWPGGKTGNYGQCCATNEDCIGTCGDEGFCSDVSGCSREHGKEDGKFGDCCRDNKDCTSPGICWGLTYMCQADENYCSGRNLGLKDGKEGDCCKTGADCLSGSCPLGTCTAPRLDCIAGYETRTDKSLTSNFCCTNDSSCIGTCIGGKCGYAIQTGCVNGYMDADDGSSPNGYCCLGSDACMGDCVNGVCGPLGDDDCSGLNCIPGHEGDSNTNLSPKYCCKDGSDCLFGCNNGACIAGSVSSCPKPTRTTTSTPTPTQTSKPKPQKVDPKDICVGACGPPGFPVPIAIGLPGFAIGFAGIFVPLLGHDDDDKTTTTTTTKSTTTTTTTTKSTTTTTTSSTSSTTNTTSTTPGATGTTTGPTDTTTTITATSATAGPTNSATTAVSTNGTTIVSTSGVSTTFTTPTNGTTVIMPTNGTATTTVTSGDGSTTPVTSTTSSVATVPVTSMTNSATTVPVTSATTNSVTSTTSKPVTSTTTSSVTSTTTSTTTTAVPTGKTCKSGYFKKNQKNGPDGSCCAASGDCIGDCVYIPGDSYMCKSGSVTTVTTIPSTTTDVTTISTIPKPTPTCTTGHCGLGLGKGPTGACCADQWDCDQVCNGDGKCSNIGDGTWTKKLPCP